MWGLLSLLYPSTCPVCERGSDSLETAPLCSQCLKTIKRYSGPSCRVCSLPLVSVHSDICGSCISDPPFFSYVVSYGLYSDVLASAINLFKFSGFRRLSKPLSRFLLETEIPDVDLVMPVPMTKRSMLERGYNQSALIAKEVSKATGYPLDIDSLQKVRETLPQVGLKAEDRAKNLKNAFLVTGDLRGKRVLLIDDVMTTGATLRECSRVLVKAGATEVIGLVLARTCQD
jgi:ComF family protein